MNDVQKNKESSALARHGNECKHKLDFENVKILDTEQQRNKRYCSEMISVYYPDHTLKKMEDTSFFFKHL